MTAVPAAVGLYLFSLANSALAAFAAAALFAAGIAFWWPTMLGITSERFPRGGALLLAVIGATGSISTAIAGPLMGWISERFGTDRVLAYWALLPCLLIAIFGAIYLNDRRRGGYVVERL
jgi:fucose permease